jgi:muramoyltetrapeptide carboxypeptidase LdcA involved in peptidoglycan recycling
LDYPSKIGKKSKIGICAPSLGITNKVLKKMTDIATKKINELGHEIKFTKSVFNNYQGRSATAENRAKEFLELWNDKNIDLIISAGGGDYMMEILDYIDFKAMRKTKGKFFQGSSDNTILTFLITILVDKATIYGKNFYEFGIEEWDQTHQDNYDFFIGKNNKVKSIELVQREDTMWNAKTPKKRYDCNYLNKWQVQPQGPINITGRIIGGLLEDLVTICGTKYDKVEAFTEKYKNDGLIWYIDSCEFDETSQARSLWQLKNANWFKNAKLIIFGRPINKEDIYDMDYRTNLYQQLQDLNIPIVFDCNIGHIPPTFYIYNGSICNIKVDKGKGILKYIER